MNALTLTLSIPTLALRPNGRAHWRQKAKEVKTARHAAKMIALEAMRGADPPRWTRARVDVDLYAKDARSKWDRGNIIASLKASEDGIADAGVIVNDRFVEWGKVEVHHPSADPRVVVTLTRLEAE